MTRAIAVLATALLAAGCALVNKSSPVKVRYFTPEAVVAPAAAAAAAPPASAELQLRLGRIEAASHIRDRIAYRDESPEISYYGTLRWTEPPEAYLRRAMARGLFEQQHLSEIVSGPGPTLEIDLEAFEELREPRHAARVVVTWRLRGDRTVLLQRTLTVEQPITEDDDSGAREIAEAMGVALRDVVDSVVRDVVGELTRVAATP